MKKYKYALDVLLLVGLLGMSLLSVAPKDLVMPTSLQMVLLAGVFALTAGFLALVWREHPQDEREAYNQVAASRLAYVAGIIVLIVALVVQGLMHRSDPATPLALLAMISTKVIVQRVKDDS